VRCRHGPPLQWNRLFKARFGTHQTASWPPKEKQRLGPDFVKARAGDAAARARIIPVVPVAARAASPPATRPRREVGIVLPSRWAVRRTPVCPGAVHAGQMNAQRPRIDARRTYPSSPNPDGSFARPISTAACNKLHQFTLMRKPPGDAPPSSAFASAHLMRNARKGSKAEKLGMSQ